VGEEKEEEEEGERCARPRDLEPAMLLLQQRRHRPTTHMPQNGFLKRQPRMFVLLSLLIKYSFTFEFKKPTSAAKKRNAEGAARGGIHQLS
jgi:hypothetical protein